MATPDPTNVLFKIAHPDLYARNPFNLLNLPIDATAKDIRRRKEDIDAAFEAGTEEDEFKYVLPLDNQRKPPTLDAVHEAFDALNDPEMRIAYSLFWFWKTTSETTTEPNRPGKSSHNPNGDITDDTISNWKSLTSSEDPDARIIACHNLAIYHHLMALYLERFALEYKRRQEKTEFKKRELVQQDAVAAQMDEILRNLRIRPKKDHGARLQKIMTQTQDLVFAQGELSDYQIEWRVKMLAAEYVALDPRFQTVDTLLDEVREFLDMCDVELDEVQVRKYFSGHENIDDYQISESFDVLDVFVQWEEAVELWNDVAASPANWRYVSEIVTTLGDPRLDYRFARSLRDQFAFAFDQINVELAIDFAKQGSEANAKRQIEFMRLSQADSDDVEGTFDDAFAGLQKQVEAIVNAAREEANKNPKTGLVKVDEILERTKESVQISRIIFDKGEPIRESIITTIFAGVRSCMIAYGNETNDWDGCLKRIEALKGLAENDRQVALVVEDERIIAGNKKAKDERERCWICKQKPTPSNSDENAIDIPLHGHLEATQNGNSVNYEKIAIKVPVCLNCQRKRARNSSNVFADFPECIAHPWILSALSDGWRLGNEVSRDAVDKFLSSYSQSPQSLAESDQRLIDFFHEWCHQLEGVLTYIEPLPLEHRFAIAQVLFDRLGEIANNPIHVHMVLQTLKQFDINSVTPYKISAHHCYPPFMWTYCHGYEFLSLLHYQNYPYHNPRHANEELLAILKKDKSISSLFEIETSLKEGYGDQGSFMLKLSLERRLLLGVLNSVADYTISVSLECISLNGKRNFLEVETAKFNNCAERLFVSDSANDSPFIIANQVRKDFARLGLSSPRRFAAQKIDASIVVSHAASIVKQLAMIMIKAINATKWKRIPWNSYTHLFSDRRETIVFMQ